MHQLNYELLEQLNITCGYLISHYPNLPNDEKVASLLSKSMALFCELKADSPKMVVYQKLSDDWKHREKSNGEVTVPLSIADISKTYI